jgi:hypothetical protein
MAEGPGGGQELVPWPIRVASRRPRSGPALNVQEYASGRTLAASSGCSRLVHGNVGNRVLQSVVG